MVECVLCVHLAVHFQIWERWRMIFNYFNYISLANFKRSWGWGELKTLISDMGGNCGQGIPARN